MAGRVLHTLIVWVVTLVLLSSVANAQQPKATKNVLVLYWYDKAFHFNAAFDQSFQAALQSAPAGTIEYYAEYLESNRFPGEKQTLLLRDYLRQKYADRTIDVIVASGYVTFEFLLKYRDSLFPNSPIVFLLSARPTPEQLAARPGITGIITLNTYKKTLDLGRMLHPDTKQVFVISGTLEHDKKLETMAWEELQGYDGKIAVTYLTDLPPDELSEKLKSLPHRSIVLYVWQQSQNKEGKILEFTDVLALIAQSAAVPVYGMSSLAIGNGIIGGYVYTAEASATRVAEIVLQILNGAQAQDIPLENAPSVPMFDWRELRRWRINENKLPRGSLIHFRELTLWDQHKWQIIAVFALCLLQAVLIGRLLIERRSRRIASDSLARLNSEQQQSIAEITALSGRLISAQEDERRRIAMELHDDLSQQVAALSMRLGLIKRTLANADAVRDGVATVENGLRQLVTSIHALSHELHPALLERAGLAKALKAHCREFKAVNGIDAHVTVEADRNIPSDLALCLYRISQEALRNVAKHSGAKEVWISLTEVDNHIHLSIEDAGRGFDPQIIGGNGIGLVSMKERVRMVGGSIEIASRVGGGTVTRVVVPVPAPRPATACDAGP